MQECAEGSDEAPACSVTLTTPTHDGLCTSEPSKMAGVGSYPFQYSVETKVPLSKASEVLTTLINSPVTVSVSANSEVVGTAQLDLLPAATHGESVVARRLDLQPAPRKVDAVRSLLPHANVTVLVSFFTDKPDPAAVEPSSTNLLDTQAVDVTLSRTPFHFVSPAEVEETSVIILRPVSLTTVPDIPTAVATAGGFTTSLGLLWPCGASSGGVTAASGEWNSTTFSLGTEKRTFVGRQQFLGLQEAVQGCRPLFAELARYIPHNRHKCWLQ
jgi:hypothetical protein